MSAKFETNNAHNPLFSQIERPKLEKLITIAEAATALGLPYWQIQRAIKRGALPSYAPFNSRRLVRLSEVVAFINASRRGGV
ncbi:helix-turn-helix transcriptional regulator [Methylopila sp. Yamaguchi]|uniref:helix-turn-helix transcriptional regulator n=1 Tax=Methylopila sp. Yamaguchi TaxID=1437817 RepID=UPI000CAEEBF7|nr:helix-turn-helix domain-containing protein [Methylopila sp. Yamaguchi]GBD47033.1 hypothetical protein METY_0246 [Methylopila sp. Yamaguchi]